MPGPKTQGHIDLCVARPKKYYTLRRVIHYDLHSPAERVYHSKSICVYAITIHFITFQPCVFTTRTAEAEAAAVTIQTHTGTERTRKDKGTKNLFSYVLYVEDIFTAYEQHNYVKCDTYCSLPLGARITFAA